MAVANPPLDHGRGTGCPVVRLHGPARSGIHARCGTRAAPRLLAGPRLRAPVGSQAFRRCVVTHFGHRSKNTRTERTHDRSGSKSRGGSSMGRPGRPIRPDTRIPGREPGRAMDTRAGPGDGHVGRAGRWRPAGGIGGLACSADRAMAAPGRRAGYESRAGGRCNLGCRRPAAGPGVRQGRSVVRRRPDRASRTITEPAAIDWNHAPETLSP